MSTIIVNSNLDTVDANDGFTTLREAIAQANANAGADTIEFDSGIAGSTIWLSNAAGTLVSTDALTINGAASITISGDANKDDVMSNGYTDLDDTAASGKFADNVQILSSSAALTVNGVNFTGGYASATGGAAINQTGSGALIVTNSNFSGNLASGNGGAIDAGSASVTVTATVFDQNLGSYGGALSSSSGSITVDSSTLMNNTANESGGAIYSATGTITITNTTANSNYANTDGGVVYGETGTVAINGSTLQQNAAGNNGGAAGSTSGLITIDASNLIGNTAVNSGGAVFGNTDISISNSSVNQNAALTGGAIATNTGHIILDTVHATNNNANSNGGVIFTNGSRVEIYNSLIESNTTNGAGGAIAAFGNSIVSVSGSTFQYNEAYEGGAINVQTGSVSVSMSAIHGNIASSVGGGIKADTVTLSNVTVANNTANNGGGGIFGSTVTLQNATVTGNSDGVVADTVTTSNSIVLGNGSSDISADGAITFIGGNVAGVIDAGSNVSGSYMTAAAADIFEAINAATGGGVLAYNDGPVVSAALKASASNIALDASDSSATLTDVRSVIAKDYGGIYNSNGNARDLGAYELTTNGGAKAVNGPSALTINEDQFYTVSDLITIAGLDDGSATVTVRFTVSSGEFSFGSNAAQPPDVTWGWDNGRTFTGTVAALNSYFASGVLYFIETSGTSSPLTLTIDLIDNGDISVSKSVTVNVNPMNDAPVIDTGNEFGVTEDVVGALTDLVFYDNDSGDNPVTVTLAVTAGTLAATGDATVTVGGTATALTLTGSMDNINAFVANGEVTYLTAPDANGSIPLQVTINDNGWTGGGGAKTSQVLLSIPIAPVNDAPTGTLAAALANGTEDTAYLISRASLLQGITDADGDTISLTGLSVSRGTLTDNGNGTYTITQPANFNGDVVLSFSVTDGKGGTLSGITRSYTVEAVNDLPNGILTAVLSQGTEDVAYTVSASSLTQGLTDVDGDTISVTGLVASHGTVTSNGNGTYTITPTANFNGTMTLSYSINDGHGGIVSDLTRTYTVDAVNDAPTDVTVPVAAIVENAVTGTVVGLLSAVDADTTDSFTYELLDNAGGRFVLSGGNLAVANGVLLDFEQANTHNVTLRVTDASGASIEKVVAIAVSDINPETIFGDSQANTLMGGAGDDVLDGRDGQDALIGGGGNDTYVLANGRDSVTDSAGIDKITSTVSRSLVGYAAIEKLTLLGTSVINGTGNALANSITGNSAKNILTGGKGQDVLTGGSGNDVFDFNSIQDTGKTATSRDIISDFKHLSDDIDLATIDASTKAGGNSAFKFIGVQNFHKIAGELRYAKMNAAGTANDKTMISGDVNGDGKADFQIELTGLKMLTAADFVL